MFIHLSDSDTFTYHGKSIREIILQRFEVYKAEASKLTAKQWINPVFEVLIGGFRLVSFLNLIRNIEKPYFLVTCYLTSRVL